MRGWRSFGRSIALTAVAALAVAALAIVTPNAALAGSAPGDGCVPGTVWEDESSGITYICIYDELYGGTRWDILPGPRQSEGQLWLYRASAHGCTLGTAGLSSLSGGGANMFVRSYRWPCASIGDRLWQPAGEIRARVVVQRYSNAWSTCRDSGYVYSTATAQGWIAGLDMGSAADCGSGWYRTWGFGHIYQVGAWRGSSLTGPSLYIR